MVWLWLGVGLWSALHFMPSLARGPRALLIARLGDKTYRILFSLGVVGSIALMVLGWRATTPVEIYTPPPWGHPVANALVLVAFLLFGLAHAKTNVKRVIRHPQLTGLVVWAIGHLLANGDSRSVVLFGALGVWALIEMPLINRREGRWVRPGPVPLTAEIRPVAIGLVIFAVVLFAHPYLFGVSPIPG